MKLFINTELDANNSLVTSQADNNPKILPNLYLGDALPLVISFTDNQGGYAHWQSEPDLSVKVAIGVLATNSLYAYQDKFEYHDNQFFGTLVLHTESLANALSGADSLKAVFEVQVKRGNGQSITTHQSSVDIQNQLISFDSIAPSLIGTDTDQDGVPDIYDAFPNDATSQNDYDFDGAPDNVDDDIDNPLIQSDTDNDGIDDSIDPDFIDSDGDGAVDSQDDAPLDPNVIIDTDADGIDDSVDPDFIDSDGDGVVDSQDDAPNDSSITIDSDQDGIDDSVDPDFVDTDGDGVVDSQDAFPNDSTESKDTDQDGVGDVADDFPTNPNETTDTDGDGVGDNSDQYPLDSTESKDTDSDGVGDNADAFPLDSTETKDTDGDGIGDNSDQFPLNPNESADTDSDGVGDNADAFPFNPNETTDTDGDGVGDNSDQFPNDSTETVDTDGDGVGDNADDAPNDPNVTVDADGDGIDDSVDPDFIDTDGDGVVDSQDAYPNDASESADTDGDGVGDNADDAPNDPNVTVDVDGDGIDDTVDPDFIDSDGDGVVDSQDDAPSNPDIQTDADGDGVDDSVDPDFVDSDGDGVVDAQDAFPNDSTEWSDNDGDGVGNNADAFPNDPNETTDSDGDGIGDNSDPDFVDTDGDGVVDSQDAFPNDASESADTDGDGIGDNSDAFPNDSTETSDDDLDGVGDNTDYFFYDSNYSMTKADLDAYELDVWKPLEVGDIIRNLSNFSYGNFGEYSVVKNIANETTMTIERRTSNGGITTTPQNSILDRGTLWEIVNPADQISEEPDSDGDGVKDSVDVFPNDSTEWSDTDSDGVGDNSDAFPNDASESADSDGDGVGDNTDAFPNDASETVDTDGDGVGDNADQYPNDPERQFMWAEDDDFVYPDDFSQTIGAHNIIILQSYTNTRMSVDHHYEPGYIFRTTGGGGTQVRAEDPLYPRMTPYDTTSENQGSGSWDWFNLSDRGVTWNFAKLTSQKYYVYGDDGVNGTGYYYPVYTENIGLGSAHTHVIDGITYYMDSSNMNHAQPSAPTDSEILETPYQAKAVYGTITDYKTESRGDATVDVGWHYPVFLSQPNIPADQATLTKDNGEQIQIWIQKYEQVDVHPTLEHLILGEEYSAGVTQLDVLFRSGSLINGTTPLSSLYSFALTSTEVETHNGKLRSKYEQDTNTTSQSIKDFLFVEQINSDQYQIRYEKYNSSNQRIINEVIMTVTQLTDFRATFSQATANNYQIESNPDTDGDGIVDSQDYFPQFDDAPYTQAQLQGFGYNTANDITVGSIVHIKESWLNMVAGEYVYVTQTSDSTNLFLVERSDGSTSELWKEWRQLTAQYNTYPVRWELVNTPNTDTDGDGKWDYNDYFYGVPNVTFSKKELDAGSYGTVDQVVAGDIMKSTSNDGDLVYGEYYVINSATFNNSTYYWNLTFRGRDGTVLNIVDTQSNANRSIYGTIKSR